MFTLLAKLFAGLQSVLRVILPFTFMRWQKRVRYGGEEIAGKLLKGKAAGEQAGKAAGEAGKVGRVAGGWARGFLGVLHILLVIAVLAALFYIGRNSNLGKIININPQYVQFYLPALALLIYALLWLGWYVLKLLAMEEEETPY